MFKNKHNKADELEYITLNNEFALVLNDVFLNQERADKPLLKIILEAFFFRLKGIDGNFHLDSSRSIKKVKVVLREISLFKRLLKLSSWKDYLDQNQVKRFLVSLNELEYNLEDKIALYQDIDRHNKYFDIFSEQLKGISLES